MRTKGKDRQMNTSVRKSLFFVLSFCAAVAAHGTEVTEAMVNECLAAQDYAVAMKLKISDVVTDRWYYRTTASDASDYVRFQMLSAKLVIPMHIKSGTRDWNKFEFKVGGSNFFVHETYKNSGTGQWTVWKQDGTKVTSSASVVVGVDGDGNANAIYYVIFDAPELTGDFRCEMLPNSWGCFCQYGCFLALPRTEKAWEVSFGDVKTALELGESVSAVPHVVDRISGVTNEQAVVSSVGFGQYSNLEYSGGAVRACATTATTMPREYRTLKAVMDMGDGTSLTNSLVFSVGKPSGDNYVERVHIQPNTVVKGNWAELDSYNRNAIKRWLARPGAKLTVTYTTASPDWRRIQFYINSKVWYVAEKSYATTSVTESIYFAEGFDPLTQFAFNWNGTVTDIRVAVPVRSGFIVFVK